ncbi:MAG: M15 family metallopeptidase, partial [Terriglobales bacterium]
ESLSRSRPELGDDELSTETQKYVSVPSTVSSRPSPHNTGGSVDLAVLRLSPRDEAKVQEIDRELAALPYETDWSLFLRRVEDPYAEPDESSQRAYVLEMERMLTLRDGGELLDFGTPFDHGGPEAALRHYETTSLGPQDVPARDNRRLLHNALAAAGFAGFPSEWWHVNAPETQMGAKVLGLPKARFGGLELDASHRDFENMRRGHHAGMIFQFERLANGKPHIPAGLPELTWAYLLNLQALESMHRRGAPPTRSGLPQAAVIAAPGDVGRRSTGATSRSPNRKNSRRPGPR